MTLVTDRAPVVGADRIAVGAVAAAAVGADLAVRSGVAGLVGSLLVLVVAVGLVVAGRVTNAQAYALSGAAALLGVALTIRTSPWLVLPDIAVMGGLLALASSYARGGSLLDVSVETLVLRGAAFCANALRAPAFVARAVPQSWRRSDAHALTRGLLLAAPIVVVLGALLASADAVFAGFFDLDIDGASLVLHVLFVGAGAWGMATLLTTAASRRPPLATRTPRLGRVETTVVLASIDVLFGLFALAQVVALSGGGQRVIETAGLTYADYARSGFFQLLAVAAITLATLVALRALAGRSLSFVVLGEIAVALTIVIVVVACRRLLLYVDAYGLTMLRLMSLVFAAWIGLVFAMLGGAVAGPAGSREWFGFAAGSSGLLVVVALNLVNPEAAVIRHNAGHAQSSGRFDTEYIWELSEDAVPALANAVPELPAEVRTRAADAICRPRHGGGSDTGWASLNLPQRRAHVIRAAMCPDSREP